MTAIFSDFFRQQLTAAPGLMNPANVRVVLFRSAPSLDGGTAQYAAARTVADLEAMLGWDEVAGIPGYPFEVSPGTPRATAVSTRTINNNVYVMFMNAYMFTGLSLPVNVQAVGVQYIGTLGGVQNPLIFVTNTPTGLSQNVYSVDGLAAQPDTTPGPPPHFPDGNNRWLFGWAVPTGGAQVALQEGPLAMFKGAPEYESANTQHVWLYPQRANMIANPSFELPGIGFWSSDGAITRMASGAQPDVFVPMYIYPSYLGWWQPFYDHPPKWGIVNISGGPGTAVNPDYTTGINTLRGLGSKLIGYVDTNYGAVPIATVKTDIDNWKLLYNVDGIFFDRVATANNPALVSYMLEASNYAKGKQAGWKVAYNHGDYPFTSAYVDQADFSIVFENTYAVYSGFSIPGYATAYVGNYSSSQWVHLIHACATEANMRDAAVRANVARAGNFHCTADAVFAEIPAYYPAEFTLGSLGVPNAGKWHGDFAGKVAESNVFPTLQGELDHEDWTIQLMVKGTGPCKVGLVYWDRDYRGTGSDWGDETWDLNPNTWTHISCLRRGYQAHTAMVRIETQTASFKIDQVVAERGYVKDWPYFDGDEKYGAPDDFSWYGGSNQQGKSYSLWYDNRRAVMGRLFATDTNPANPDDIITDDDVAKWGLVYQWVPAGVQVVPHTDVFYPGDLRAPVPPKSAGISPYYNESTQPMGVINPWV